MPKMKTHNAIDKRFKVKKKRKQPNGTNVAKVIKCTDGRGHFNARENGKTKRNKRSDKTMSPSMHKTILRAIIA